MRIRTRRFSAALIALFPPTLLLVVLTPSAAQAVTPTQNNGCLGVTGTFSQFAVPIAGTGTPNPVTAPSQITLSGSSVTIAVDATLISAGITTGLVSAAPDLAHIGVSRIASPPDGTTTPDANGGISAVQAAAGK